MQPKRLDPWRIAGVVALVVTLVAVGVSYAIRQSQSTSSEQYEERELGSSEPPTYRYKPVAYLGDDYTVGVGSEPRNGFTFQLNRRYCWNANTNGQSGTGFVAVGPNSPGYSRYFDRITDVLANNPEFVIVQSSGADAGLPGVEDAAKAVFQELRSRAPQTELVVLGPFDPPGGDHAALGVVRDQVMSAASSEGIAFIDPLAEAWTTDSADFDVSGLIPKQRTYVKLAAKISNSLEKAGISDLYACEPLK